MAQVETQVKTAAGKRRRIRLRGFIGDSKAATAVEFALIAVPFLALIAGLLQTFLLFFAQATLENVTRASARQIMTGQAQTQEAGMSSTAAAAAFQQTVCNNAGVLFTCSGLIVDVRVANNWTSADTSMLVLTYNSSGQVNNVQFNPGNAGDIVVVRVMYFWPFFFGSLSYNWGNQANGSRQIMASAAFQNEPAVP
jgi:Flp pilus assembly protein TadG